MIKDLTRDQFAEHLNQTFQAALDDGTMDLELIEADAIKSDSPDHVERQPFALLFRGPMEPVLEQQVYALEHVGMGTMELFLVPIGPDDDGMRYEAVFT